jgi:hypothetical protein
LDIFSISLAVTKPAFFAAIFMDFNRLVDLNNLGDGTTYLRNPTIARIAHKIELVEKLGSGVSRQAICPVGDNQVGRLIW